MLLQPRHPYDLGLRTPTLAPPPESAPDTLRVVTWNIQRGTHVDRALEEIHADPHLAGSDLYFFQELDLDDTRYMAHGLGLASAWFAASRNGPPSDDDALVLGNAVLSRWPIEAMRRVALPHGGRRHEYPRAATIADLRIGDRLVRAVSTHTATPLLPYWRRLEQARVALRAALDEWEGPIIVGGDFNTLEPGDETDLHGLFRDEGFEVARPAERSTIETWWRRWLAPRDRLDHLFARGLRVLRTGVVTGTKASDHRPVWALLRWAPILQDPDGGASTGRTPGAGPTLSARDPVLPHTPPGPRHP